MTSPPDKLFRDHLEQYHTPAPPAAWDKIEAGLGQRQTRRIWMKVAAGITILLAASVMLWPKPETLPDVAIPMMKEIIITPSKSYESNVSNAEEEVKSITKIVPDQKNKTFRTKTNHKKQEDTGRYEIAIQQTSNMVEELITQPVTVKGEVIIQHETSIEISPSEPAMIDVPATSSRPTLVYSAYDVQSRFLKKTITEKATPEGKSPSGLKKVMDIAASIKYDEGAYGNLRQKKNEILSLGFLDQKHEADKN